MNFDDKFFSKVEKKTKVDKETILSLAQKLNSGNLKEESSLREVIRTLSSLTGKKFPRKKRTRLLIQS